MRGTESIQSLAERIFPTLLYIFEDREFTTYLAALQVPPPSGSTFAAHEQRVRIFLKQDDRIVVRKGPNKLYFRIKND